MASLTRSLVFAALVCGSASAATLEFVDPANGDYRLATLRGLENPTMPGGIVDPGVYDFTFWHGMAFQDVPAYAIEDFTADPRRLIPYGLWNDVRVTLNAYEVQPPDGAAITNEIFFPQKDQAGPLGDNRIASGRWFVAVNWTYPDVLQYTDASQFDFTPGQYVLPADRAWVTFTPTLPGDANLDGLFGSDDLVEVLATGLYESGQPATWTQGDFDRDGLSGTSDLVTALATGAYEAGPVAATAAVPEPSGMLLLAMGLLTVRRQR